MNRHWKIVSGDNVDEVDGPGVIGLFPIIKYG